MNLADPAELKALLTRCGWRPQKGLGQHFLISRAVVDAIAARVTTIAGILEIGPGPGVLTSTLAAAGHPIVALEVDPVAVAALAETAPDADVRHQDALAADLPALLAGLPAPRAVVSNLPYHLTAPLLDRILGASAGWDRAVLMMQREVGQRILAPVGDRERGALSLRVQHGFEVERVALVPGGAFLPPPKVESIVLEFRPRRPAADGEGLEPALQRLWRAGFAQPRKTLANNLASLAGRDRATAWIRAAGLGPDIRPHEVPDAAWVALARQLAAEGRP